MRISRLKLEKGALCRMMMMIVVNFWYMNLLRYFLNLKMLISLISSWRTLLAWTRRIILIGRTILTILLLMKIFGLTVHGLKRIRLLRWLLMMVMLVRVVGLTTIVFCKV